MENKLNQAKELLKEYGQEHILDFIPKLSKEQVQALIDQIVRN